MINCLMKRAAKVNVSYAILVRVALTSVFIEPHEVLSSHEDDKIFLPGFKISLSPLFLINIISLTVNIYNSV